LPQLLSVQQLHAPQQVLLSLLRSVLHFQMGTTLLPAMTAG
jgi:hypothetical protein